MRFLISLFALSLLLSGRAAASPPRLSLRTEPYVPHEGYLMFFHSPSLMWDILFWLAGSHAPDHCGIVVLINGEPHLLEAAPDDGAIGGFRVCLLEAEDRLRT